LSHTVTTGTDNSDDDDRPYFSRQDSPPAGVSHTVVYTKSDAVNAGRSTGLAGVQVDWRQWIVH